MINLLLIDDHFVVRERCRKIAAEVEWQSQPSNGTQVTISCAVTEPQ